MVLAGASCGAPSAPAATTVATASARSPEPEVTASAPAASASVPAPPPQPERVRFLSVGDVLLGRDVGRKMAEKNDPEWPFRPLASLYASVDFTFANLEAPFFAAAKPAQMPPGKKGAVMHAHPSVAPVLVKHRFLVANLANNHAMDQGLAGLTETLQVLDAAGIVHMGTGPSLDAAWEPAVFTVRGVRIAFVGASYASVNDMGISRNAYVARIEDEDRLEAACRKARASAHFVVATMHAGDEHKPKPNAAQRAFARAAVKHGADVVIGAHPHVLQPAEKVEGKWVFYSLGNYVFDHIGSDQRDGVAVEMRLRLDPGAARAVVEGVTLHPVVERENAPGPAHEKATTRILARLGAASRELEP